MVRLLVTGSLGYVGSALVSFITNGRPQFSLVGLDTGFFPVFDDSDQNRPDSSDYEHILGDIRDVSASDLIGFDAIVHLAAISNDPMGDLNEGVTYDINLDGTLGLARAAKEAGVRKFVFASSCSVYGQAGSKLRSEEDSPGPLTAYAKSKVLAEEALKSLAETNFRVDCLRYATAAGWSPNFRSDLVVNDLTLGALRNGVVTLKSDGLASRPIIDVTDMARAALWASLRLQGKNPFEIINIGSEKNTLSIREIAQVVARAIPKARIEIAPGSSKDIRSYKVSFEKMRSLGGFTPTVSVEQIVDGLVNAWPKLRDSAPEDFVRINKLSKLVGRKELDQGLRWTRERYSG